MPWTEPYTAKAKDIELDDDDYEDYDGYEDFSAEPTREYTEDYAEEAAPPAQAQAAVTITFQADVQQRKLAAAEARQSQQQAAEAKAAFVEESREWLACRGFLVTEMAADSVVAMRTRFEADEAVYNADMAAIVADKELSADGVNTRAFTDARRVHMSNHSAYVMLDVALGYPGTVGQSVTVKSNSQRYNALVNHVIRTSGLSSQPRFLVRVARFAHYLLREDETGDDALKSHSKAAAVDPATADAAWIQAWCRVADGEHLKPITLNRESLVITHAVPSMFARVDYRGAAPTRVAGPPRKTKEAPSAWFAGRVHNASRIVEEDSSDLRIGEARQELLDRLASMTGDYSTGSMTLFFANRPLGMLPPQISKLRGLTQIDLSDCGLRTLPSLGNLRLEKLFLSRNLFDRVPAAILEGQPVSTLRILDMAFNRVEELPEELGAFRNMEVLQFDYNRVRTLCSFDKMKKLQVLELTDNSLTKLPKSLASLTELWRLKIGANPIVGLPPEIYFQGLEKIREFLLELTPHNLPVSPSTLGADLRAVLANEINGPDLRVKLAATGTCFRACSFMVEARAPRLLTSCAVVPIPASEGVEESHEVTLTETCADSTIDAFVKLIHGELSDGVLGDVPLLVELSGLVANYGSSSLSQHLQDAQRSKAVDVEEMLSKALEAVGRRVATPSLEFSGPGRFVTFAVGPLEQKFTVHRALVCQRCPYLHRMLTSGLAESSMDVVPLPAADADIFGDFLLFLYTDCNYKMTPENVVALLFMAVEYECQRLRDMAECMVGYNVEVENVAQVIQLAYFLDSTRLKEACMWFVSSNYGAVRRTEAFHLLQDELKVELAAKLHHWGAVDTAAESKPTARPTKK